MFFLCFAIILHHRKQMVHIQFAVSSMYYLVPTYSAVLCYNAILRTCAIKGKNLISTLRKMKTNREIFNLGTQFYSLLSTLQRKNPSNSPLCSIQPFSCHNSRCEVCTIQYSMLLCFMLSILHCTCGFVCWLVA